MPVAKRRSQKKEAPEEKPIPIRCRCGLDPIPVKIKGGGYIVSCRDPLNCVGNFITFRHTTEGAAIKEWNNLIRNRGENK